MVFCFTCQSRQIFTIVGAVEHVFVCCSRCHGWKWKNEWRVKIGRHVVFFNDKKVFVQIRCTPTECSFLYKSFTHSRAHSLVRSTFLMYFLRCCSFFVSAYCFCFWVPFLRVQHFDVFTVFAVHHKFQHIISYSLLPPFNSFKPRLYTVVVDVVVLSQFSTPSPSSSLAIAHHLFENDI